MTSPVRNPWLDVADTLAQDGPGSAIVACTSQLPHPLDAGMRRVVAFPAVGQREEYGLALPGGDLRVRDFGAHYEATLLPRPALETMLQREPGSAVLGAVVLGALLGTALGKSRGSALTGALIGGFASLAGTAVANAETSQAKAQVAGTLAADLTRSLTPLSASSGSPGTRVSGQPLPLFSLPARPRRPTEG